MTDHPLYPERQTETVTIRGVSQPGWFTGPAAIWTGGHSPRVIGPFPTVTEALKYQGEHAAGSQVFPIDPPQ